VVPRSPDEEALGGSLADFDSLVFSPARPALDETVPWSAPRPAEGLAGPPPCRPSPPPPPAPLAAPLFPDGDLAAVPLPRFLAVLHTGQATGALSLARGAQRRLVLFDRGAPVFATSNAPADRFGATCVREGLLDRPALRALLAGLRPGETTSAAMLSRGLLTSERRAALVEEQVKEIVWSVFAWPDGAYRFSFAPLPARERIALAIFPGELILEGMRRAAPLDRLRAALPPSLALAPAPDPAFDLHRLALRSREAEMLAHADGTKGVRDLVALSGLAEREGLAFLQACRHMGILAEVEQVLASTRRMGFL
jgi:hypothetical protein